MTSLKAAVLAATVFLTGASAMAQTPFFTFTDDPQLSSTLAEVRAEFMRGKPFDRFDVTLLVPETSTTWRRASYNPDTLAYPASCVKLAYLAAAMHWCRENNLPPDHLDHCVRPMVVKSDNVQTGVVIDAITSTTNIADQATSSDVVFLDWCEKRLYPENFLKSRGLLGDQTTINKTYPTNSGEMPAGAEKVLREYMGMNKMSPRLSAELILEIVGGAMEPQARPYMLDVLDHDTRLGNSIFGWGLPPGSKYYNKPGLAYDTLEDIAYIVLPNGREFVLAGFSNAFCLPYSAEGKPHNSAQLGRFCEMLIERTGLDAGCPPKVVVTKDDEKFAKTGAWATEDETTQTFKKSSLVAKATDPVSVTWKLDVPKDGKYEVSVWYVSAADRATSVPYIIAHAGGETTVSLNQHRVGGFWQKLGDFQFKKGMGEIRIGKALPETGTISADAVKAVCWPETALAAPVPKVSFRQKP